MTRQEEIQKAAEEHGRSPIKGEYYYDNADSFEAGAEWADKHPAKKQSIWHDADDIPPTNSKIVIIDIDRNVFNYTYGNENWEQVVETNDIVVWAYLDDLTNL